MRPEPARAEPWVASTSTARGAPTLEASAGADVTAHGWAVYSSLMSSIGGSLLEDGWRIRLGGGYGAYSYSSTRWTGSTVVVVPFDGTVTFADALIGYQQRWGALTLKVFAGAVAQHNSVTPIDVESTVRGTRWGGKGAVEAWLDIGASAFAQLDLSYATIYDTYGSRLRLGYKFTPQLSIGPEAGLNGNVDYDSGRLGAFVRYDGTRGEISVSAGAAGDRSEVTGGYATINALLRF
ncbi:MAG: cellulose biosynthesis protein BcsS [Hyphomicrobiaceae bacterium]